MKLDNNLKSRLEEFDGVYINSNEYCSPYVLNISVIGIKPETLVHALEQYDVYISTQTACSSSSTLSKAVLELTGDEKRASSSVRISLSCITTQEEIDEFISIFEKCYKKLKELK